jgi:hypothetical protein
MLNSSSEIKNQPSEIKKEEILSEFSYKINLKILQFLS